jgi:hypothetical protein
MKGDVGRVEPLLYQELTPSQKQFLEHLADIMNIDGVSIWTAETVFVEHAKGCETCQETLWRIWLNEFKTAVKEPKGCSHRKWGTTIHCAELTCHNYAGKFQ